MPAARSVHLVFVPFLGTTNGTPLASILT
jgi:hypothetical protein